MRNIFFLILISNFFSCSTVKTSKDVEISTAKLSEIEKTIVNDFLTSELKKDNYKRYADFQINVIASVIQCQGANHSGSSMQDFPEIWNAFVNIKTGDTAPEQHTFIGNHYVNIFASALEEYGTGNLVNEGSQINEIYKDLAWSGLFFPFSSTSSFPNLSNSDLLRISVRQKVEMDNSPFNGVNPTNNLPCIN